MQFSRRADERRRALGAAAIPALYLLLCQCSAGHNTPGRTPASNPALVDLPDPMTESVGVPPVAADSIDLSPAEVDHIRTLHARAAILLHYSGNDWSNAQVAGLKFQFAQMGVDVILVTDAGFRPEKQVADVETALAMKPDVVVSIPTDPVATAGIYKKLVARKVKLVFMDDIPRGFVAGTDYISMVSADNYGNGVAAANLMAHALGEGGKIGIIFHASDFSPTRTRYEGFKNTIAKSFPRIQVVDEQGIGGPDFSSDAERAAGVMMVSHRDLNGIWAVWDIPAEGVISAARTLGRDKLVVTTCDLGENVAIDLARGRYVRGIGAQRPFDQGVVEAKLAGYGLVNKKAPGYVVVPALAVTRDNLVAAWRTVYHKDAPSVIRTNLRVDSRARPLR